MIEKIVYDYLKSKISLPIYMEIPSNPPQDYITISRTSGGEVNHIESATFSIQSYSSKSLLRSAEINELVKTAMRTITDTTSVMKCKLNNDYNFTNTTTKVYRYQAVFNLNY